MDNLLCWNVRGLNAPNKQKEIKHKLLCNKKNVGFVGLVETKIKANNIAKVAGSIFGGWEYCTNHIDHYNGRVWILWRADYFQVQMMTSLHKLSLVELKIINYI